MGGPYQWTELDRAKQFGLMQFESSRCPRCNEHPEDWTYLDDNGNPRPLDPPPHSFKAVTCHSCTERTAVIAQKFGDGDNMKDGDRKQRAEDMGNSRMVVVPYAPPTGPER